MKLSQRSLPGGAENALSRAWRQRRARGLPVRDLASSNPGEAGLRHAPETLAAALARAPVDHAPDPFGAPEAREAVCAYLRGEGLSSDPARTLLTSSTSEAYGLLFKLLCDPGDRVLAPSPSYPLFEQLARLEGVELSPYPLRHDGRWHIDLPALREAAGHPRVRAVLLVSPNNPTGNRVTREELDALAELGLPLVSDEVFSQYVISPAADAAPSALAASARTLVFRMGGLSKCALLPQAKLAWTTLAGPEPDVAAAAARLQHLADAYLSPSAFVQAAAGTLLEAAAPLREALRARLRSNVAQLEAATRNTAVTPLHVEGGWSAILRLPAVMDEEAWALALLEAGTRVQPGYFYDLPGGPHVVLSLLTPEDTLREGLQQLLHVVAAACR